MTTLLHLDAGAHRDSASISRRLTARFVRAWSSVDPSARRRYRDLVVDPVPPIGSAYCALGRRVERLGVGTSDIGRATRDEDERREWAATAPLVEELMCADVLLLGAPMYNFGVPAALKAWIDRVTFPRCLRDAEGQSLLRHLDVVVVSPRGGSYPPTADSHERPGDFVGPYLRGYFTRYGVPAHRIHVVTADHALASIVPAQAGRRAAAAASLGRAVREVDELALRIATSPVLTLPRG